MRDEIELILFDTAYGGSLTRDLLWLSIYRENFMFTLHNTFVFVMVCKVLRCLIFRFALTNIERGK